MSEDRGAQMFFGKRIIWYDYWEAYWCHEGGNCQYLIEEQQAAIIIIFVSHLHFRVYYTWDAAVGGVESDKNGKIEKNQKL